jgi:hypothetical protein
MYICKKCTKCFDKKYQWLNHINKRYECSMAFPPKEQIVVQEPVVIDKKPFKCDICKAGFSTRGNLKRHNTSVGFCCENFIFKNESGKCLFVKSGNETTMQFTKEVLLELLDTKSFTSMCTDMAKLLYFNRDAPENCNWCIAYAKNDKAAIIYNYNLNQFERKPTMTIINDRFSNMMDLIQPLIEEIYQEDEAEDILNKDQKRNIARFYALYGVYDLFEESPDIYEAIHDMAFNNKIIPMHYWKKHGLSANHLSIKLHAD